MNNTDFVEITPIEPDYDNSDQLTELQKELIRAIDANQYDRIQSLIDEIPAEQTDFYWFTGYDSGRHPLTTLMINYELASKENNSIDHISLIKCLLNKTPTFTTSDYLYPRLFRRNYSVHSIYIIAQTPIIQCLYNKDLNFLLETMMRKVSSQAVLAGGVITILNKGIQDNILHQILDKVDNYDINLDWYGLPVDPDDEHSYGTIKQLLVENERWDTILRMVNMGRSFAGHVQAGEAFRIPIIWGAALERRWDVVEAILSAETANMALDLGFKAPPLSEFLAMVGQKNILTKLAQLNISPPRQSFTIKYLSDYTFFMCLVGMYDKVIDVLNAGFDQNATVTTGPLQGYNLIFLACTLQANEGKELYNFLDLCIEKQIDLDNYLTHGELASTNTLWYALSEKRWDLAEYLLEHGACPRAVLYDVNYIESSCQLAARGKQWELCKKLITKGADPNIFDELNCDNDNHVLFQAIYNDNFDMVEFLIHHKANLNLLSKFKHGTETALHACVSKGNNFKLFRHLLKNGANPNLRRNVMLLDCILISNMTDKNIWALEAIKYGADISKSYYNLNIFGSIFKDNPVDAALSLLYFFSHHPSGQLTYYAQMNNQEKDIYNKVLEVFNLFVNLPFFEYQTLNIVCQTKLQLAKNLPFELRVEIICLWLSKELNHKLGDLLPISATSAPKLLEASSALADILDGSELVTTSALQTTKVFQVIFTRLVTAMLNNQHLIYQPDAEHISRHKKFWTGVLFKQFSEVIQEQDINLDLSLAAREKMSYRINNFKLSKSARVHDHRADFTWLFRLGMYGTEPVQTKQLLQEASINRKCVF